MYHSVSGSEPRQKWYIKVFVTTTTEKAEDQVSKLSNKFDRNEEENEFLKNHSEKVESRMKTVDDIKFFIRHLETDLHEVEMIFKDVPRSQMKSALTELGEMVKNDNFNYTHIMLLFSAPSKKNEIICRDGKKFKLKKKLEKLNAIEKLVNIPKLIIVDTFPLPDYSTSYMASLNCSKFFNFDNAIFCRSSIQGYATNTLASSSLFLSYLFYEALYNAYHRVLNGKVDFSKIYIKSNESVSLIAEDTEITLLMQVPFYFSTLFQPLFINFKDVNPKPSPNQLHDCFLR